MTSIKRLLLIPATAVIVAFSARPAAALPFNLDLGNPGISGFPGPYAHVVVTLTDSTHATITFTGLTAAGNQYLLGGQGAVGLNVNGTFTLGTVTGTNAGNGFSPGPYSNGGVANEDGWGPFNLTIDSFDGFQHSADFVSVALTSTGVGGWANEAAVLTANANGYVAAAHIFVTSSPADSHNTVLATGYAASTVPDGGMTVSLLGLALGGLGMVARRRK